MLQRTTQRVARTRRPLARSLWRCSTLLSTSPSALAAHFAALGPTKSTLSVLSVSKNMPPPLLAQIRTALTSPTIGCLSELLPPALAASLGLPSAGEAYSIALATYEPDSPSAVAVPFHTTLQGRPNISLGREHKAGPRSESTGDSSDEGFQAFLAGKKWGFGEDSRKGGAAPLPELVDVAAENVKEIICFTTDRSQPLMKTLAGYPSASTLGLLGSLTPFHSPTGASYTLFHDQNTISVGAVGVAIVDATAAPRALAIEYAGLTPLAAPLQVTSAKGNIVLTLDEQNAARLLLHAVQALPSPNLDDAGKGYTRQDEKEKEFFAAVFEAPPGDSPDLSLARHVSKIMAGDPSRGAMSVETEEEVKIGSWLVFLHRPSLTPVLPSLPPSSTCLSFLSIAPSYHSPKFDYQGEANEQVVSFDGFVAASENGVVLSRKGESWVCSGEGAAVSVGK